MPEILYILPEKLEKHAAFSLPCEVDKVRRRIYNIHNLIIRP